MSAKVYTEQVSIKQFLCEFEPIRKSQNKIKTWHHKMRAQTKGALKSELLTFHLKNDVLMVLMS